MTNDNIILKRALITLSILWALVVIFFVWTILSIDPRDQSISLFALFNAEGSSVLKELILFFIFAFGAWAIPTNIVWQLASKFQRYPIMTTVATALFAYCMYLIFTSEQVPSQIDSATPIVKNISSDIDTKNKTTVWQCSNTIEISCVNGKCQTSEDGDFTPMSVNLDELGSMSVCAYTGCWEGTAQVIHSSEFVIFVGNQLAFSTSADTESQADIVVAIDKTDAVGMLKVGEFVHPVLCE